PMAKPQPAPIIYRLRQRNLLGELPAFPQNVPAGDYLVIEVQDHGSGMTPEIMAQALDPFFTTKEVGQGTGLGMPVAFGIINGHQGFLTISSERGRGTRVRIHLPRLEEDEAPTISEETPIGTAVPVKGPARRILVVDDE